MALLGLFLGPKIKQDMKTMCEYIKEGSGILTLIGWDDLKTNEATLLTAKDAHCVQFTALHFRILSCETELQASLDGSRLMGEPPYHLRMFRKCASTWVFATKTHSCLPHAHGFVMKTVSDFCPFGREPKERNGERRSCVIVGQTLFQKGLYIFP